MDTAIPIVDNRKLFRNTLFFFSIAYYVYATEVEMATFHYSGR